MKCCSTIPGKACHCAQCHNTFPTLAAFDRHQDVDYNRKPVVLCRGPARLGLVRSAAGTWVTPKGRQASLKRVTKMRSARGKEPGDLH